MIGASNKGRGACWIHTDAGTCREPPRPGLHTCLKHREQEDKARGVVRMFLKHRERYGYGPDDGLDPWTKREREIENALAVGHGAIDESEDVAGYAAVRGLARSHPEVAAYRAIYREQHGSR